MPYEPYKPHPLIIMKSIEISGLKTVRIIDKEKPEVQPGEVLLKIEYVSFCGSDLNTYLGRNALAKSPVIPGHEISATIAAVGTGVPESLTVGLQVTVDPYTGCGHCAACRRERSNACEHNQTLGVQRDGAMQEWLTMPWQKIIPAPGISQRDVALVEPMSVGFHAVSRADIIDTDIVMVIGCGMIGMGAIVRAAMRGATVVAVDVDDKKLEVAHRVGATHTINSRTTDLHARLMELTDGLGVDVVIEAVGNAFTQRQAIEEVSFTGRVVFIGYAPTETNFLTKLFVQKELDIRGSRNAKPSDFRAVIHFMQTHPTFPTDELVTRIVTPEQAGEALEQWDAAPSSVFRILANM